MFGIETQGFGEMLGGLGGAIAMKQIEAEIGVGIGIVRIAGEVAGEMILGFVFATKLGQAVAAQVIAPIVFGIDGQTRFADCQRCGEFTPRGQAGGQQRVVIGVVRIKRQGPLCRCFGFSRTVIGEERTGMGDMGEGQIGIRSKRRLGSGQGFSWAFTVGLTERQQRERVRIAWIFSQGMTQLLSCFAPAALAQQLLRTKSIGAHFLMPRCSSTSS